MKIKLRDAKYSEQIYPSDQLQFTSILGCLTCAQKQLFLNDLKVPFWVHKLSPLHVIFILQSDSTSGTASSGAFSHECSVPGSIYPVFFFEESYSTPQIIWKFLTHKNFPLCSSPCTRKDHNILHWVPPPGLSTSCYFTLRDITAHDKISRPSPSRSHSGSNQTLEVVKVWDVQRFVWIAKRLKVKLC